MERSIYEEVLGLSCDLVNASTNEDTKKFWRVYHHLEKVCKHNEGLKSDHPLQWEALADFTTNDIASLAIYKKALGLARQLKLTEYSASIHFAIAERLLTLGEKEDSLAYANIANKFAEETGDLDLRRSISAFLLKEHGSK